MVANVEVAKELETLTWKVAQFDKGIPVVTRVGIKPEMLDSDFIQEYGKEGGTHHVNVVYDREFAIAKVADALESTGIVEKKELDAFTKEVVTYRMKQIATEKEQSINELRAKLKLLNLSAKDLEALIEE